MSSQLWLNKWFMSFDWMNKVIRHDYEYHERKKRQQCEMFDHGFSWKLEQEQ